MLTFDQQTQDSAGAFLVGELERLDQTLHQPLSSVTWSRDIMLRNDVTMGDETSSFSNSTFASAGGPSESGKAFIGKNANAIQAMQLDISKTPHPLTLWAMQLGWTLPELASAQQAGRPIDAQKFMGMQRKHQMDTDEMVYVGDDSIGATGLLNDPGVSSATATTGNWSASATGPDKILADVNEVLKSAWKESGWAVAPSKLLLPPDQYSVIVQGKVSTAGNISILQYLQMNSLSNAINGTPLDIQPVKWLTAGQASANSRMVAYSNQMEYVRFPMVPIQRTPVEYRDLRQLTTYFGRMGQVEVVYPSTIAYRDGI